MSTYEPEPQEETEPRTERALTECMSVLPESGDVFTVVGENGATYRVDRREERCTCPDHKYRDIRCKHLRRVAFATGEEPVPLGVDGVDPQLGEHTEASPRVVASDGGILEAGDEGEVLDEETPEYSYHIEPPNQGGARYVRCEYCGREVLGGDPDRIPHRDGCPNGK